ncbi:hypothetical protein A3A14_00215 [Candidatus Daviesbacteria bacterium RIFCSPLOWO2_01_FULL_43_38]|uniref:Uncharacterized protein n=1 Tax=Candidatus Daviesbacteria bacterium RIFCSPHIGHO2_12_FULL_43_11 TaxID=1797780 RepID=A0A1F5K4R9_9BACT|nr:MAG: hypothetical protein A2874_00855 [Candidatus Daviesbacteria bacterium RIFCSPHIGHO2_01_FULL_43_17]OGE35768.1 MAG: hypothetical protein A3E45_00540 [Candidatus Daviesbacteria bacterium RIFCSPHIGHO2_12_FULL_43_11]OGE63453.1 MAG: hypothetical protein A3A14_00215 [Candidatus Daviesbacteria bacterium RIFCSPLOWO2_01_FULL_43_38]OGE69679.1 MAG: hypothetical protein A3J21_03240 [Candidatus Daviesbacteria bacterium RIFCSPLOWO2_02_FULL_43_11]
MTERPQQSTPESEPESKPTRLLIEHDNGKIIYLEGKDLDKYLGDIDNVLMRVQLTRQYTLPDKFMQVEWKKIDPSEVGKLFEPQTAQVSNNELVPE